jgi:chemotaxis signal transduction protein
MNEVAAPSNVLAALQTEFDRAFAAPPVIRQSEQEEHFLALRVATEPYVVRIREIAAIARQRKTITLPGTVPEFLGITGVRGASLPVYSLAALLGLGREPRESKWLLLCGHEDPVALTFAEIEGHYTIRSAEVFSADRAANARSVIGQFVAIGEAAWPIISLPALIAAVKKRCDSTHTAQESF